MTDLKKTMFAILSGEISLRSAVEDMTDDECQDLFKSLELLDKAKFISPENQKKSRLKAQRNANIDAKQEMADENDEVARADIHEAMDNKDHRLHHLTHLPSGMHESERNGSDHEEAATTAIEAHLDKEKAAGRRLPVSKLNNSSHLKVIKAEVMKFDGNGQWSIEKADDGATGGIGGKPKKPAAPTLDYGKMNAKPDYKDIEAKADTIDYSNKRNVQVKKPWAGAAAQRDKARAKIDAASKQSAVEHLAEKRSTRKRFGV